MFIFLSALFRISAFLLFWSHFTLCHPPPGILPLRGMTKHGLIMMKLIRGYVLDARPKASIQLVFTHVYATPLTFFFFLPSFYFLPNSPDFFNLGLYFFARGHVKKPETDPQAPIGAWCVSSLSVVLNLIFNFPPVFILPPKG